MGIDIVQYRASIGSFLPNGNNSFKSLEKQRKFESKLKKHISSCLKWILMLCVTFLALAEPNSLESNFNINIIM